MKSLHSFSNTCTSCCPHTKNLTQNPDEIQGTESNQPRSDLIWVNDVKPILNEQNEILTINEPACVQRRSSLACRHESIWCSHWRQTTGWPRSPTRLLFALPALTASVWLVVYHLCIVRVARAKHLEQHGPLPRFHVKFRRNRHGKPQAGGNSGGKQWRQ